MAAINGTCRSEGPAIWAVDAWEPGDSLARRCRQLLSDEERADLATIASTVRFKKGEKIYSDGEPAATLFNIVSGVAKTYKTTSDGNEHIVAFLHPQDLFGLSENGRYANSAKALTPIIAYALPISVLRHRMSQNAVLEFRFVEKLCHGLRQAQDHALILSEKRGLPKLAMFLHTQERRQSCRGEPTGEIYLPMGRTDIARYVGMSLGAVSRGFRALVAHGVISNRDRRHVKIVDRKALERMAAVPNGQPATN